jgi:hypothetical protein
MHAVPTLAVTSTTYSSTARMVVAAYLRSDAVSGVECG